MVAGLGCDLQQYFGCAGVHVQHYQQYWRCHRKLWRRKSSRNWCHLWRTSWGKFCGILWGVLARFMVWAWKSHVLVHVLCMRFMLLGKLNIWISAVARWHTWHHVIAWQQQMSIVTSVCRVNFHCKCQQMQAGFASVSGHFVSFPEGHSYLLCRFTVIQNSGTLSKHLFLSEYWCTYSSKIVATGESICFYSSEYWQILHVFPLLSLCSNINAQTQVPGLWGFFQI